jgi:hypothetical protein
MTPNEFQQFIAQHGGIAGQRILDPYIKDENDMSMMNPTPQYRLTFGDGTEITTRTEANDQVSVLDWGTAGPKKATAAGEAPKTITTADGRTLAWDAEKRDWTEIGAKGSVPATVNSDTSDQFILTRMPDGTLKQEPNPNYRPPVVAGSTREPKVPAGTTRMSTASANGRTYQVREVADGYGGWSLDSEYSPQVLIDKETDPNDVAYKQAQTGYQQALTDKTRAEMAKANTPAGVKAIQDMYDSIGTVQGMMESGKMSPAEASAYMDAFKQNLMASMQGTTPWQMKEGEQDEERQRADIGRALLNQRVSSGSGVAQSLIGLLGSVGGKLMAPPGSIKFDPFAMAEGFTDRLGGGAETSELAKSLLGQLRPGAAPSPAAYSSPNTAMAAGVGPVAGEILTMLARQPDLAAGSNLAALARPGAPMGR